MFFSYAHLLLGTTLLSPIVFGLVPSGLHWGPAILKGLRDGVPVTSPIPPPFNAAFLCIVGDEFGSSGDDDRDVGVLLVYLGGVTKFPDFAAETLRGVSGFNPRNFRCSGVKAMSEKSSGGDRKHERHERILKPNRSRRIQRA